VASVNPSPGRLGEIAPSADASAASTPLPVPASDTPHAAAAKNNANASAHDTPPLCMSGDAFRSDDVWLL